MKSNLEDILKNKFSNFEAEPTAGLFDEIIQRSSSNRRLIWLRIYRQRWVAAILLLLLTGSWWILSLEKPVSDNPSIVKENNLQPKLDDFQYAEPENKPLVSEQKVNHPEELVQVTPDVTEATVLFLPEQVEAMPNPPKPKQFADQVEDIKENNILVEEDTKKSNLADQYLPLDEDIEEEVEDDNSELIVNENELTQLQETTDDGDLIGASRVPSRFSIAVSLAPGYAYRKLSGTDESYSMQRNHTENAALSWQWSADLRYRLNVKWNVNTGIRYSLRNENFLYHNVSSVSDTQINSQQVTVYHPVNPPRQITVYDTTVTQNTYENTTSGLNRYRVLSIPLELERVFYFYDKWSVMAKAGVLFNVYSSASGTILRPNGDLTDLANFPGNEGELRMNLGLGAAYRLNETLSLLLYPQLNYGLFSTWNESVAVKQHEYGVYTHLGMRIDL